MANLDYFYLISTFLYGLVIGSFLNVCIYRLPREGLSIIRPSSFCPNCKSPIQWYYNIPLFSFIILRGRCSNCAARISFRYPLVELITGCLFVLAASIYLIPYINSGDVSKLIRFILSVYLIGILIVVTFIDIEFRIIPDELTISGIVLALLASIFFPAIHKPIASQLPGFLNGLISSVIGIITGGGIIYLIGLIGKLIFRKEAMGFGDVKLMAFLGGFLGWEPTLYTFFVACLLGSIIGIILYFITKDHYIAFGPYIAMAALITLFFEFHIIYLIQQYQELIRHLIIN